ncbi:phage late control D family protein [Marinobacterium sedimentorum]|uniref:phage late control D family protein n=1 Tax=Marinobacterium sedimentorum TaxID=2927804 RepID=UPI0020C6A073|nr:phage late control D family protein [Marinobacterium sedimentorum]MCP8687738.1 phage late control D family protein [Marinobacterium sedimentorum]
MKPDYRLVVNGQNITPKVNGRLISLTLTDERGEKSDQLDITLSDHDGTLAIPPRNASIGVWIGYQGALTYKGSYTLDEVVHAGTPDTLTLRARSADFKGPLKHKRQQSWHGVTLGDILNTIAGRSELTPVINQALAATAITHIDQTNESDLNLLTRLGQQYGALATIKDGRLLFAPAGTGSTASGTAIPAVTITRQDGDSHSYQLTDRDHDYTGVQCHWHNTATGTQETVTAGDASNPKVLRHSYPNHDDAAAAASAHWRTLNRAGAKLSLTLAEGRPDLYPETPVQTLGFKAEIDETQWVLERVVHELGDSGYTTRLEMEVKRPT